MSVLDRRATAGIRGNRDYGIVKAEAGNGGGCSSIGPEESTSMVRSLRFRCSCLSPSRDLGVGKLNRMKGLYTREVFKSAVGYSPTR